MFSYTFSTYYQRLIFTQKGNEMRQEVLIVIGAIVLAIIFCFVVYKWMFTPRQSKIVRTSLRRSQKIDKTISYRENEKVLKMKISFAEFFSRLPLVRMTDEDKEEIQQLLLAVDKRVKSGRMMLAEEFYFIQLGIAGAIFLICVMGMLITPLTIVGILIIPFCMRIPIKLLQAERNDYAVALADEFLAFYKLYYVQFIRPDNTTTLSYVINSYLPSASTEVKRILKVVDGDLSKGEEYALKRFDQRFPDSPKVHKFCAVAQARIKGDETCYETLKSLLDLLQEEHNVYFNKEREKRERKLTGLVTAFLMTGATIVCFMTFIMMFTG